MHSRMDKYELETPELKKRTDRNKDLYHTYEIPDYDKFDVNSNVSILKNNAREIDVDQIRAMLDKKYRDNVPQRKSIDIPKIEELDQKDPLEDTKEYDLNSILSKAKDERIIDYDKERLTKASNSEDLISKINNMYASSSIKETEDNDLEELINTITSLELKNQNKDAEFLGLSADEEAKTQTSIILEKKIENEFNTGQLAVTEDDYEDFKDIQKDIKSNSIFIKVLAFIFIIILIVSIIFVINNIFDLGLF